MSSIKEIFHNENNKNNILRLFYEIILHYNNFKILLNNLKKK